MLILIYLFLWLSAIFCMIASWLYLKHGQWRRKLEPKFNKFIFCRKTGYEIARTILDANKLNKLPILEGSNPNDNFFESREGNYGAIYLSPQNYNNQSLRTLAVAAHECGHAINFNQNRKLSYLTISKYPYIFFGIICILTLFTLAFGEVNIWLFMIGSVPGALLIVFRLLEEKGATYRGIKMLEQNSLIIHEEKDFVKQYLYSNLLDYVYKFVYYISAWNLAMALIIVAKIV